VDADNSKEENAANGDDKAEENDVKHEEDVLDEESEEHLARLEKVSIPPL